MTALDNDVCTREDHKNITSTFIEYMFLGTTIMRRRIWMVKEEGRWRQTQVILDGRKPQSEHCTHEHDGEYQIYSSSR